LKVTFLGTGTSQGVPVIACQCKGCQSEDQKDKRLRSAVLIEDGETCIVIDTGPDFREQMLRENVRSLSAVLITHAHRDHIAGLDDIRSFNWVNKRPMDLYAEKLVMDSIMTSFPYIFVKDKYPGVPQLILHEIDLHKFSVGSFDIEPIRMQHHQLPVLGFRIGDFAYLIDSNFIPDDQLEKLKGLKYLVIGALRREKHISHFSVSEALEIIEILQPEKAYLTHISHQLGLQSEFKQELPDNVYAAYDQLVLEV